MSPRLLLVAHGTRSAVGRQEIDRIVAQVREQLAVEVRRAWVDVLQPTPEQVLADGQPTIVVPAFLARGYHVVEDIAAVVASAPGPVVETSHLGNEPEIRQTLWLRLQEAHAQSTVATLPIEAVVLACAGSRDPGSVAEVHELAGDMGDLLDLPVVPGFASANTPTVAEAIATLRERGHSTVAVATHLLAPGFFADRIAAAGADITSVPLGAAPAIVELIVRRYREAVPAVW